MTNKAAPLVAMRAFEAAARLRGFKAAAIELSITPGAIAQHIKTLETWTGSTLFERMSHGVKLTPLGESVIDDFSDVFDRLARATQKLRENAGPSMIRIATSTDIAQLWLDSRLPDIRAIHSETTITLTILDHPPNLDRDPYDLSLFFRKPAECLHETLICRDAIFPVCSPALAINLGEAADLAGLMFIHDSSLPDDWQTWMQFAASDQQISATGPSFPLYSLALQEAQNGAGIMIGHEPLVRTAMRDGKLVAPFPQKILLDRSLVAETRVPVNEHHLVGRIIARLCESS